MDRLRSVIGPLLRAAPSSDRRTNFPPARSHDAPGLRSAGDGSTHDRPCAEPSAPTGPLAHTDEAMSRILTVHVPTRATSSSLRHRHWRHFRRYVIGFIWRRSQSAIRAAYPPARPARGTSASVVRPLRWRRCLPPPPKTPVWDGRWAIDPTSRRSQRQDSASCYRPMSRLRASRHSAGEYGGSRPWEETVHHADDQRLFCTTPLQAQRLRLGVRLETKPLLSQRSSLDYRSGRMSGSAPAEAMQAPRVRALPQITTPDSRILHKPRWLGYGSGDRGKCQTPGRLAFLKADPWHDFARHFLQQTSGLKRLISAVAAGRVALA